MGSILSEDLGILGITGGEDCTGTAGTRVSGCRDKGGMVKKADGAALSGVVAEGKGVGEEGRGEGFIVDGISARTIRVLNRDGQCIIYILSEMKCCKYGCAIKLHQSYLSVYLYWKAAAKEVQKETRWGRRL